MLNYKDSLMHLARTPRCRRERLTADVTDAVQRRVIFAATGPAPALMITEGLLMYLPAAAVQALAAEASEQSGIAHWMADITTTTFAKAIKLAIPQSVRDLQAADFLNGEQIVDEVRRHGWTTAARRSYITDMAFAMERIQRMRGDQPPPAGPPPVPPDDPTGVHVFSRG